MPKILKNSTSDDQVRQRRFFPHRLRVHISIEGSITHVRTVEIRFSQNHLILFHQNELFCFLKHGRIAGYGDMIIIDPAH